MGLLDRFRRPDRAELAPRSVDPYALSRYRQMPADFQRVGRPALPASTAGHLAGYAFYDANAARTSVLSHQGAEEDLASIKDSLDSVYQIAAKLDEIDRALLDASGNGLYPQLGNWTFPGSEPEQLRSSLEIQGDSLAQWADQLDGEAKRRWYGQMLELRGQIVESLLSASLHVRSMKEDLVFLHGATAAQGILPDFSVQDAQGELLTTENAAAKARSLSETVAELEPPQLSALDEAQALPALEPAGHELEL